MFDNVDACKSMVGSGEDRYALARKLSGAWVAFDTARRATMILNDECKLVDDPHGNEQRLLRSIAPPARV